MQRPSPYDDGQHWSTIGAPARKLLPFRAVEQRRRRMVLGMRMPLAEVACSPSAGAPAAFRKRTMPEDQAFEEKWTPNVARCGLAGFRDQQAVLMDRSEQNSAGLVAAWVLEMLVEQLQDCGLKVEQDALVRSGPVAHEGHAGHPSSLGGSQSEVAAWYVASSTLVLRVGLDTPLAQSMAAVAAKLAAWTETAAENGT